MSKLPLPDANAPMIDLKTGAPKAEWYRILSTLMSRFASTESAALTQATDNEIRAAATGAKSIIAERLETAAAMVTLEDAPTIAVDWDTFINADVTVTDNRGIGNPTNGQPGTYRSIVVKGNNSSERTITFGNQFGGEVPEITDCTSTKWYLVHIRCVTASHFVASAQDASPP